VVGKGILATKHKTVFMCEIKTLSQTSSSVPVAVLH